MEKTTKFKDFEIKEYNIKAEYQEEGYYAFNRPLQYMAPMAIKRLAQEVEKAIVE